MKVIIKYKNGRTWTGLPIESIKGQSIINYISESKQPIVAALFNKENKPIAYISNEDEYVEMYRKEAFSAHAKDLQVLFGGHETLELMAQVYPEAGIAEVETL